MSTLGQDHAGRDPLLGRSGIDAPAKGRENLRPVLTDHDHPLGARPHAHFHAAVLKVEDYGGETTVLFTTDAALDRIMLQKAARALGSRDLAVARKIVLVRELPVLRSGKTDYPGLEKLAQIERLRPQVRAVAGASLRIFQQDRAQSPESPEAR